MTPILFYGVPEGCSLGSIVAFEWTGLPYRLCRVDMPETVSGPGYRRLNPIGETPTLVTETGAVLSESMAILNHIGSRAIDSGLAFRQGSAEFDRLNAMLAFLNTSFFNAYSPLWHTIEHEMPDVEKAALVAYGTEKVAKAHAQLDRLIGSGDWLLGDRRSLADAYFIGIARWAEFHRVITWKDYPAVYRLYQRLQADPAIRFALAIEHGETAASTGNFAGALDFDAALRLVLQ